MGQAETLKIFEKYPNFWFNAKEIAKKVELGESSARANLRRLANSKNLIKKEVRKTLSNHRVYLYKLNTTKKR